MSYKPWPGDESRKKITTLVDRLTVNVRGSCLGSPLKVTETEIAELCMIARALINQLDMAHEEIQRLQNAQSTKTEPPA